MDSSSRKIVGFVGILTVVILIAIAGSFYTDATSVKNAAAIKSAEPLNDNAEAAISAGTLQTGTSEFSADVPQSEDIPAINGAPSMVLDGADNTATDAVSPKTESESGTAVIVE